ncbi:TolC family protein [Anatilimnocola sp. NA78]|uniref:TolC family protein n=1 Tax=Anatilimnocola sp. NA78 TaxID=3415683 RepID=UPI003CE5B20C
MSHRKLRVALCGALPVLAWIGGNAWGQTPPPKPQPAPTPQSRAATPFQFSGIRHQPAPVNYVTPVAAQQPLPPPAALPAPLLKSEPVPVPVGMPPQPIQELTIEILESIAQMENPSIGRAASLVEAAKGNWVQVGLAPNPTTGYEGQQLGSGGRAEQHGVFVEQELVRGGKLRINREVAAHEIGRASQELAAQRQRVTTDVRIAFYQALVAQRQEQLTNHLSTNAAQNLKASQSLFDQKEVGKLDVLQAQLESRNMQILIVNARNRRAASWQQLATLVGRPHWSMQILAGDLDQVPQHTWQQALHTLLGTSPEIAIAMTNIERARWQAERARVEKTPNITVRGLVNVVDNGIDGDPDGSIMVGMPLPIWNRNQGALVQAQHQAAAAERALEQLELNLQNRLAPVYERYSNALNQVKEYRENILPVAQETLDLSRRLYEAGEGGFINLLTAQRTFTQTNLAYLEALRELRTAAAEIEGLLLSNSLQAGGQ